MTDKSLRILFTSVGRRVELIQAFTSAAQKLGCNLEIHGADISDTAPALSFCNHTVIAPKIKDMAYIPFLLNYCREHKIDALIPTIDTDLMILSENKASFKEAGTLVLVSAEDKIALCRDKRLTYSYFDSVGLLSPNPIDNYENYSEEFPAFIKPKDGSSSIFAYKVNSKSELESYAKQVPDYIIQPYIEGTEYTVDVFCDFEGNPVYITPRIRLAVRAGEVLKAQIVQDDVIIEEVKTLLKDFRPCGAITVQLIRQNHTGKNYYIEINPRFGGGAPLSMNAGADSASALLKLLCGESVDYVSYAAEDGATYCRFDQSIRVK